jgi:polar amino acid transport system substrate-binding protein
MAIRESINACLIANIRVCHWARNHTPLRRFFYKTPVCIDGQLMNQLKSVFAFFVLLLGSPFVHADTESVTLYLNWKHQFENAGFYMAKEKGFYKDVGLDVDIREFRASSETVINQVTSQTGRYGLSKTELVLAYLDGAPVRMLANFLKHSPLALVTRDGIRNLEQLRGKRILAAYHDINSLNYILLMREAGLSPADYELVEMKFDVQPFIRGETDAALVYLSNELFEIERAGINYNIVDPTNSASELYDLNLFTSDAEVENYPDRARRMTQASIKGWNYALEHPEEAIDVTFRKYNSQGKSRAALEFEAKQIRKLMLPALYEVGSIDPNKLERIARAYIRAGMTNQYHPLDGLLFDVGVHSEFNEALRKYRDQLQQINMCVDPDWMPFEAIDEDGKLKGISSELFPMISDEIDVPIVLVPTASWAESLEKARNGECDILSLASPTDDRREHFLFSNTLFSIPTVIATHSDQLYVEGIEQILDKPIGVVKGYAFVDVIRKRFPSANIVEVENGTEGLRMVQDRKLFAFVDYAAAVVSVIRNEGLTNVRISGEAGMPMNISVATRIQEPLLNELINHAIEKIGDDKIQNLYNKSVAVSYTKGVDYSLVWKVIIGGALIVIAVVIRYYRVSRFNVKLQLAQKKIEQQKEELERLATLDALTGINNRLSLDRIIQQEQNRYERFETPWSLVLLDIDNFKRVNDECGHLVGDEVLVSVSSVLRASTRKTDYAGRWGGEEFVIVCPVTETEGALLLAEHLRAAIEAEGEELGYTASFGVATIRPEEKTHELFHRVDRALYKAKQEGKNRVVSAD